MNLYSTCTGHANYMANKIANYIVKTRQVFQKVEKLNKLKFQKFSKNSIQLTLMGFLIEQLKKLIILIDYHKQTYKQV